AMRIADRERALELTQEAFTRTWEYQCRGNEIHEYRPFLFRTLRHLIIDEYRKGKMQSLEALVEHVEGGEVEDLLPQDDSNTLEAAMERYDSKRALMVLKDLPDLYRETLTLRYVESLTPGEIAEIIGERENVLSVRIHRGLKKLRDRLESLDLTRDNQSFL